MSRRARRKSPAKKLPWHGHKSTSQVTSTYKGRLSASLFLFTIRPAFLDNSLHEFGLTPQRRHRRLPPITSRRWERSVSFGATGAEGATAPGNSQAKGPGRHHTLESGQRNIAAPPTE